MNPFINLKKSSQYGGIDEHLVNINHIVRIAKAAGGSQVFTVAGSFFCDESQADIAMLMMPLFGQDMRAFSDNWPGNTL
jgi:hypothetical protein